jgi:hypothetical protein
MVFTKRNPYQPPEPKSELDAPTGSNPNQDTSAIAATRQPKRRLGVDPSLILSEGRSKRRKTPTPVPDEAKDKGEEGKDAQGEEDPRDTVRARKLGLELVAKIMKQTDSEWVIRWEDAKGTDDLGGTTCRIRS